MSLLEIKKYLMQVKMTSLTHLCAYFKADADTLRQMLKHWVNKGCVRQCLEMPACGSRCMKKCHVPKAEIYEWITIS